MDKVLENLKSRFEVQDEDMEHGAFVSVPKKEIIGVLAHLKEFEGFKHLVLITAVDWIEDNKFQLTYLLNSPTMKRELGVRTFIERSVWPQESVMDSAHHLWPAAKTYQRELHEMFGIDFPDSPEVNEPLILEYWDDVPPYRRDFDTKQYSEDTYFPREGRYTREPEKYMKEQMYAREGKK